jgi:REP element-mobilizing transposase RayT
MQLSAFGEIVAREWNRTPQIRAEVIVDAFVVMPNHMHAVIYICGDVGAHGRAPLQALGSSPGVAFRKPRSLGSIVAGFKSATSKQICGMRGTPGASVWQRNYHDRIVRDDDELNRIRQYIIDNPANWAEDPENPLLLAPPGVLDR